VGSQRYPPKQETFESERSHCRSVSSALGWVTGTVVARRGAWHYRPVLISFGDYIMIGGNHLQFLKNLPPQDFDREVQQALTDSLQELVACVEPALRRDGNTLHACVIDDFQVKRIKLGERDCRLQLRFRASARRGIGALKEMERITGRGEAVIDDDGQVHYQHVAFAGEPTYVAHDLGGSD
jgi:hypothetical protein